MVTALWVYLILCWIGGAIIAPLVWFFLYFDDSPKFEPVPDEDGKIRKRCARATLAVPLTPLVPPVVILWGLWFIATKGLPWLCRAAFPKARLPDPGPTEKGPYR
jgi:hypothetical protein